MDTEQRLAKLIYKIQNPIDASEEIAYKTKEIENKSAGKDIEHREILVLWVIIFASCYMLIVFVILFIAMFRGGLSNVVLITLLGTTTANVLGLPYIVLKGLFKKK